MSFREKMQKAYAESYVKKMGDRLTQLQGNIVSVKVEEKAILWIFHKLIVTILVKQERSKTITKCVYKRNRWFKKPTFIPLNQGNLVIIQGTKGVKGKGNREIITILNLRNLSTKTDLVPMEGKEPKTQRVRGFKY
jgi:hypothetical protein